MDCRCLVVLLFLFYPGSAWAQDKDLDKLIKQLSDGKTPIVRTLDKIEAYGEKAAPAIPALIKLLSHKEYYTRHVTRKVLVKIGPAVVKPVLELLKGKDKALREQAIAILQALGNKAKSATPALLTMLNDPMKAVRVGAVLLLKDLAPQDSASIAALIGQLGTEKDGMGDYASQALGAIGKAAVPAVLKAFQQSPKAKVRDHAALTMGHIGPDAAPAIPLLVKRLKGANDEDLVNLRYALSSIGPKALPALIKCLKSPNERLQGRAARTIGLMDARGAPAIPTLRELLFSDSDPARRSAVMALGDIGAKSLPTLREALKDQRVGVRYHAIEAIFTVARKDAGAVKLLIQGLDDKDRSVQITTLYHIGVLGSKAKAARPKLEALTKSPDKEIQGAAKQALRKTRW